MSYNIVLVLGIQPSESVLYIYIHAFPLFQIRFPYMTLQSIMWSSLRSEIGPYWLSVLYSIVGAMEKGVASFCSILAWEIP